ncbi:hypothetical protein RUM43_003606, partial [Polyplax serrata]
MSNTIVIIDWCNKHGGKIGKENDREKEINDADKSFSVSVKAWKNQRVVAKSEGSDMSDEVLPLRISSVKHSDRIPAGDPCGFLLTAPL